MKQFYFLIGSTFVIGFFAGVFIFFSSRGEVEVTTGTDFSGDFAITADAYGGCQMLGACPSYRIEGSGDYMYIQTSRESGVERFEDELTRDEVRELESLIAEEDLAALEDTVFTGTCPSAFDGLGYTFVITTEDAEYEIDTCEQDAGSSDLVDTLIDYFRDFERVHSS